MLLYEGGGTEAAAASGWDAKIDILTLEKNPSSPVAW